MTHSGKGLCVLVTCRGQPVGHAALQCCGGSHDGTHVSSVCRMCTSRVCRELRVSRVHITCARRADVPPSEPGAAARTVARGALCAEGPVRTGRPAPGEGPGTHRGRGSCSDGRQLGTGLDLRGGDGARVLGAAVSSSIGGDVGCSARGPGVRVRPGDARLGLDTRGCHRVPGVLAVVTVTCVYGLRGRGRLVRGPTQSCVASAAAQGGSRGTLEKA